MKKAGIILVRMDSRRFPNKAFAQLGPIKLIEYPILQLLKSNLFYPIIATTSRSIDDPLEELAKKHNVRIFRGDLENVSKRVIDCLNFFNIEEFARVNGENKQTGFFSLFLKTVCL